MSFTPFTVVQGPAIPLMRSNIDTDVIIRIERMTALPSDAWGPWALEPLRYREDGSEDPDSILNQPRFRGAPFLLAGANFGCGSSREPAVTALQGMGIRAVIAPSFGDIFHANCFQNGLLPIRLSLDEVRTLAQDCESGAPLTIDLQQLSIQAPGGRTLAFDIDATRREALIHGLDDIGLTLKDEAWIAAWQQADRLRRPWAWPASG